VLACPIPKVALADSGNLGLYEATASPLFRVLACENKSAFMWVRARVVMVVGGFMVCGGVWCGGVVEWVWF